MKAKLSIFTYIKYKPGLLNLMKLSFSIVKLSSSNCLNLNVTSSKILITFTTFLLKISLAVRMLFIMGTVKVYQLILLFF